MGLGVYHTFLDTFHRKSGRAIASLLVKTKLTPNMVTALSTIVAFASAWAFSEGIYEYIILGAILFEVSQILDYADGELARAKKVDSKYGAWLDEVCDFAKETVVLFGITFGVYRMGIMPLLTTWIIGVIAIASLQFRVLVPYANLRYFSSKSYKKVKGDLGITYKLSRLAISFIALSMFLFAAINMIHLFLIIYAAYNLLLAIFSFTYFNSKFRKTHG